MKKSSIKRRNQNEEKVHNWKSLRTTRDDLSLDRTLPTGQSFRWQKVEEYDDDENKCDDVWESSGNDQWKRS